MVDGRRDRQSILSLQPGLQRPAEHPSRVRRLSDNLGLNAHRILISNGLSNDCDSALEQRSSYQGHTVDALAMRGEEGRGQLR